MSGVPGDGGCWSRVRSSQSRRELGITPETLHYAYCTATATATATTQIRLPTFAYTVLHFHSTAARGNKHPPGQLYCMVIRLSPLPSPFPLSFLLVWQSGNLRRLVNSSRPRGSSCWFSSQTVLIHFMNGPV